MKFLLDGHGAGALTSQSERQPCLSYRAGRWLYSALCGFRTVSATVYMRVPDFQSYLSGRFQFVRSSGSSSTPPQLICGVSRESNFKHV